ncbi:hypothetical protein [Capnocytophaga catalasegens]|uniref:hypothetical protein n=1 Tax=Capnocytophaga catalasegens TaxID=1004260 RepID=UPI0022312F79|nr:hypothetical protein [Capnocytophaga catalasegens]
MSFAKNGDMSSAQMAVLSMLLKTNFLGDIMMNLTLNIMQKPMREIMVEGLERDKRDLDTWKFRNEKDFKIALNNYVFLRDIYKKKSISYQSMQGLLDGTIKRWKDLQYANEEVTLLYKYMEKEDVFIIDAFFMKTKNDEL